MSPISENSNSISWRWQLSEIAQPEHVEAAVEMSGYSSWWHAGSITKRAMARQATLAREQWVGTGIPCPRLVTIAAMGGAMLELSLTCSPSIGCTASGSATAAGACSSVGRASADIVDKTVRGTVGYSSYSHTVVVDGDFGFAVADDSVGIDGKISKKVDWKLDGTGFSKGEGAELTPRQSLGIGFAQCLALCPGMSRSMVTIVAGYLAGLKPAQSAEFSFLVGLPTLAGAAFLKSLKSGPAMIQVFGWSNVLLGAFVAAISALIAVKFLVHFISRHGLAVFAYYRLALAVALLVLYLL
jgi:hypothetical protein